MAPCCDADRLRRLPGPRRDAGRRERRRSSRRWKCCPAIRRGDAGHERARPTRSRRCARRSASTRPPPDAMSPGSAGMLQGDLGRSYTYSTPVIRARRASGVAVSLPLALIALALTDADRHSRRARSRRRGATARPTPASWARRRSASPCRTSGSRMLLVYCLRRLAAAGCRPAAFPAGSAGVWPALQGADPAGRRAGPAAGGDPRARHALGAARDAERGLYPHRPRQGPEPRRRRCGGTRCATR